nr:hypothetical protein [Psychrobacter sp. PraFG1]
MINIPMGILGFILGFKLVPDIKEAAGKLDWFGLVYLRSPLDY